MACGTQDRFRAVRYSLAYGAGSKKELQKYMERLQKCAKQMFVMHNQYFLSLHMFNIHSQYFFESILPALLTSFGVAEAHAVDNLRNILLEYMRIQKTWRVLPDSDTLQRCAEDINSATEYDEFLRSAGDKEPPSTEFMRYERSPTDKFNTSGWGVPLEGDALENGFLYVCDLTMPWLREQFEQSGSGLPSCEEAERRVSEELRTLKEQAAGREAASNDSSAANREATQSVANRQWSQRAQMLIQSREMALLEVRCRLEKERWRHGWLKNTLDMFATVQPPEFLSMLHFDMPNAASATVVVASPAGTTGEFGGKSQTLPRIGSGHRVGLEQVFAMPSPMNVATAEVSASSVRTAAVLATDTPSPPPSSLSPGVSPLPAAPAARTSHRMTSIVVPVDVDNFDDEPAAEGHPEHHTDEKVPNPSDAAVAPGAASDTMYDDVGDERNSNDDGSTAPSDGATTQASNEAEEIRARIGRAFMQFRAAVSQPSGAVRPPVGRPAARVAAPAAESTEQRAQPPAALGRDAKINTVANAAPSMPAVRPTPASAADADCDAPTDNSSSLNAQLKMAVMARERRLSLTKSATEDIRPSLLADNRPGSSRIAVASTDRIPCTTPAAAPVAKTGDPVAAKAVSNDTASGAPAAIDGQRQSTLRSPEPVAVPPAHTSTASTSAPSAAATAVATPRRAAVGAAVTSAHEAVAPAREPVTVADPAISVAQTENAAAPVTNPTSHVAAPVAAKTTVATMTAAPTPAAASATPAVSSASAPGAAAGTTPTSIEQLPYYHGALSRAETEALLTQDGDFLVRQSANTPGGYALSFRWQGTPRHMGLPARDSDGQYRLNGITFSSLVQLLNNYRSATHIADCKAQLQRPIERSRWQIMHTDVMLDRALGKGQFGDVYAGVIISSNTPVAVKICRPDVASLSVLEEAEILKRYNHRNIVRFIGVCVVPTSGLVYILTELMPNGDLLQYLRNHSELQPAPLLRMALDACAGMVYLESQNCIHRDLAARNCLVAADLTVKIADFGMSRLLTEDQESYTMHAVRRVPVKWTAPESLLRLLYTSKSDGACAALWARTVKAALPPSSPPFLLMPADSAGRGDGDDGDDEWYERVLQRRCWRE